MSQCAAKLKLEEASTLTAAPYYQDELITLYCGDSRDILPRLGPGCADVLLTDPVWPNCSPKIEIPGQHDTTLFPAVMSALPEGLRRWIIVLGCDSDPRFLRGVPESLPFLATVWLRRIPPTYKGHLVYSADVAYVFGTAWTQPGRRVLSTEFFSVSVGKRDRRNTHPCPRPLRTMVDMIGTYSNTDSVILDPFAGSGTTLVAAKHAGRRAIGIVIWGIVSGRRFWDELFEDERGDE
ncbi:MAG: site-specific DNA-methyltransferase [Dehalogenimonas sp.]|nr:site-specific DNA-methyltransferase [Dehalogenimonas sp.]